MPLAAVCPAHGPFKSGAFAAFDSHGTTVSGSEPCPVPGCGRESRIAEGRFDFDHEGMATVLTAPSWSRDAIEAVQRPLREAAAALRDKSLSDADAFAVLNEKLDRVLAGQAASDQNVRELTTEVRALRGKLSRSKLASMLLGIVFVLGMIADAGGAIDAVSDLLEWATSQYDAGLEPAEAPAPFGTPEAPRRPGASFGPAAENPQV